MKKLAFLIIGDEILCGKTRDINLQTLALKLGEKGYEIGEVRIVADEEEEIIKAVNELRKKYFMLFTSGGIGPTHDDITTESVAKAFGVKVIIHEEARLGLAKHYEEQNLPFNEARLKMAMVPEGATLIYSPQTKAPGFKIENTFVLAGIPSIFNGMVDAILSTMPEGVKIHSLSLETDKVLEGTIATELGKIQKNYQGKVFIGSYPKMAESGKPSLQITFRSKDLNLAQECKSKVEEMIEEF
jgi:molybdenum cofactor synthesis domain-containing protein